ncbi:MAG: phage terminase small subunit [Eubacteriaceae bacterium]|nr:phage terminase small subunit [Eubacteriaceae bacterium]MDK2904615.1 phage terminase small subunit [Eubacteriaceae bacterium]MDK2935343.1 phage terminase small subunit [Eubacteriaceae bacterium]MDK2961603.1 phage terminase small subunit [Eubacteriaceae bacterium]
MTEKQKRFADEYLIDLNATQAAIRAGYSEKFANTNANKLLQNTTIKQIIDERLEEIRTENTATAQEVLEYLTKGMRMELQEEVVLVVDGEAQKVKKQISIRDANKCAELLGKRYRLYIDKIEADISQPVVFGGENELED